MTGLEKMRAIHEAAFEEWLRNRMAAYCPKQFGLKELDCVNEESDLCKKCWITALESEVE